MYRTGRRIFFKLEDELCEKLSSSGTFTVEHSRVLALRTDDIVEFLPSALMISSALSKSPSSLQSASLDQNASTSALLATDVFAVANMIAGVWCGV